MSWLNKIVSGVSGTESRKKEVPQGLWQRCTSCSAVLYKPELEKNLNVCGKCDFHMPLPAGKRLDFFLDKGERIKLGEKILPSDPLRFKDSKRYKDRLTQARTDSGEDEALLVTEGTLEARPVVAAAFEFKFMGGSMGSAVGQRFVAGVEVCLKKRIPFICFSASGGARMQEGLISLFQMSKTSAALARLAEEKIPYVSVMTHPTYGGVSASLALLGDINIAEPRSDIGFAGKRVIKQTVKQTLPEGFQTSEFLLEHGALDLIVQRDELRTKIASLLNILYPLAKAD